MKHIYETVGSLKYNMWISIHLMMKKRFSLAKGTKISNLKIRVLKLSEESKYNLYKPSFGGEPQIDRIITLSGVTENDESVKFSITLPNSNFDKLVETEILNPKELTLHKFKEGEYFDLTVSGTWNGYNINRVKILEAAANIF
jgi:hypothetical protein